MQTNAHFNFKADSIASDGTFSGYASVFNNVDSYQDVIVPGAFKASIARDFSSGLKLPMLWQHDATDPIGVFSQMSEDTKGLFVTGQINLDVQKGREAYALLKQGAISGMSIGYAPVEQEFIKDGTRILKEIKLYEVSLVTFPANERARVTSVKSEDVKTIRDLEHLLRDAAGLSRVVAKTIASRFISIGEQRDAVLEEKGLSAISAKLDLLIHSIGNPNEHTRTRHSD